jgi:SAM-dependent methyltransferase
VSEVVELRSPHPTGLARSARLLRLYRREPVDPAPFYEFLADDTVEVMRRHGAEVDGLVIDVGGGPGYLADAIRTEGGRCLVVEYDEAELHLHERTPGDAVVGDGQALPLRSDVADVVHCSNVLEHVVRPRQLVDEMVRVLRPGGIAYLSYTPWWSPWGGHETSPWHFVGGRRAADRYQRRTGHEAKNLYDRNLFVLHLPTVRGWLHAEPRVEVVWEGPRYWPPAWGPLCRIPGVGEVISWNYLAVLRRVS